MFQAFVPENANDADSGSYTRKRPWQARSRGEGPDGAAGQSASRIYDEIIQGMRANLTRARERERKRERERERERRKGGAYFLSWSELLV